MPLNCNIIPFSDVLPYIIQKPTPCVVTFSLNNGKGEWEQLRVCIYRHSNHKCAFVLFVKMCTIYGDKGSTVGKTLN